MTESPGQSRREWLIERWPRTTRRRVAIVVAVLAIVVATVIASSRLLRLIYDSLDVVAYLALFVACWIGAGGLVVPIPGVRAVSLLMIVQQGGALEPIVVALVGALAMVTGQTSYYLTARAAASRMDRRSSTGPPSGVGVEVDISSDLDVEMDADDQVDAGSGPASEQNAELSRRARYTASAARRIQRQIREHGMATVYLVTALPSPMTSLTTTAAARIGMGYGRWSVAALAGFLTLCAVLVAIGQGLFSAFRSLF